MWINFFDSNLFIAIITLIVGSTAIFLYRKQQKDNKRDAANIILLEIKSAERKIKSAKSNSTANLDLSDELPLMKNDNWSKNKYLFLKDFDRDEWDAINDFYEKCSAYDNAIVNGGLSFSKNEEQIRINAHRIFADYIKEVIDNIRGLQSPAIEAYVEGAKQKAEAFKDVYLTNNDNFVKPLYTPQKYFDDRKRLLELIDYRLSAGSVGKKLKRISKIKP